ncbi:MAG: alpha-amylase family glycosyl hydrolase [Lutibacter sp.]|nr:alpha-amylase family glycosyl hydrolase [Lutibacter sp.]
MKKTLLFILLSCTGLLFSQVSTVPTIPTANSQITVTFNAVGTPLAGYTGDVYAHTGVTANGVRWSNVIGTWGTNTTQPKLTRSTSNANLYTLVITPTVYGFYGVATTVTITELNFVFRSSDGSTKNGPDIFIPIYAAGLNVTFTNPANNSAYNLNSSITISAEASVASNLVLFVNGTSIKTATNATVISTSYLLATAGNQILKAVATNGTEVKETTINIFVKTPTVNATKPAGLKYGFNKNPDNSVTFLLKAPLKTDVLILGDFNNWTLNATYQMKKDGEDFWLTVPALDINTEYAYQYFIDYSIKVADPYSEKILDPSNDQYIKPGNYPNLKAYPTNLTTGFVSTFLINEPAYTWNVTNFIKPGQNNLIIYELHIRDFTESDSYNEALTHLDYLQSLGVNAIELMPVNEFEGNDSWGYNPALYMALDKAYGTKNDFKKFVDECHQRGIAVLADVVFNHSYSQSPLLQMYWDNAANKPAANNPWYNVNHNLVDNTNAHWGYDFDHESAYTKAFFNDVLSYWMNEYKIDGFRFDFTKGFSNTLYYGAENWASAYDASRITILKNYADHVWSNNLTNKPYVIFEHLSENLEETVLANHGIMLWGNMNHSYNQNTMGYASDSDISWISYKNRNWNNPNVVGYMESHDEERLMYKNLQFGNSTNSTYNVKNLTVALARQELAGMFFFTIPGPKMIWQFGELGYDISINFNDRVGRKPIHWDYVNNANRKQIYNTWSTLTAFKKQYPDVFNTTNFTLNTGNTLTKSIVLRGASIDVVIVGNFDVTAKPITANFTKTGTWHEYFTGEEKNITNLSTAITLNPGEYKMYSTVKLLDPRGGTALDDSDGDNVADSIDLCPNTFPGTSVNSTGCPIFTLPANNFNVEVISETCPDRNNGKISISATQIHNYIAKINGISTDGVTPINISDKTFSNSLPLDKLQPGIYTICISVSGETYEQCFEIKVIAGEEILASVNITSGKASVEIKKGTAPFTVFVNGMEQFETSAPIFSVDVKGGDVLEVKTAVSCEGIYAKTIDGIDGVFAYPNPTQGAFEITVPTSETEVIVELYNFNSQLISTKKYPVVYGKVQLSLANKPTGVYITKVLLDQPVTLKIIKQ